MSWDIRDNNDGTYNYNGTTYNNRNDAESARFYDEDREWHFWNDKKNTSKASTSSGCLGLLVLIFLIVIGVKFGFKGIIATFGIIFFFACFIGVLRGKKTTIKNEINQAWELYYDNKPTQAYNLVKNIGEKHIEAAALLTYMYYWGEGCNKDYMLARKYGALSKKQYPDAQALYGLILYYGLECDEDKESGKRELLTAAVKNSKYAMLYLSEIHVNEKITNGKTLEFLNIAAESKLYYAYFLLGRIYLFGNGTVRINEEKGWDYIEKAAQLGVKDAIQMLEDSKENN